MLQYYLRSCGLTPAWIGSSRFIFSHDLTDRDFAEISSRFVAAAQAMENAGWFWCNSTTAKTIKRRVMSELVQSALGLRKFPFLPRGKTERRFHAPAGEERAANRSLA